MAAGVGNGRSTSITDVVLAAIAEELAVWRSIIDAGQVDGLKITVHFNPKLGTPRRVQVAPERNRELTSPATW